MFNVVAQPHPLKLARDRVAMPDGLTLADMLETVQPDPILRAHAHIWIHDQYIPRDLWRVVRPKPGVEIVVKMYPMNGGGGGGGKNPLRTVLTIAVIAASFYFAGPLGEVLASQFGAAGAVGSSSVFGSLTYEGLAGALIAISGTLLVNVIAPIRPPKIGALSSAGGSASIADSPTLFIEGAKNEARPFAPVPVVLGTHRHYPPLGAKSYTEVVGEDNYVRLLFVWGYGPLKIENIKIGETPIEDFDDVQIETREGRNSDDPITLFPDSVDTFDLSILLTQANDWQTRTAPVDADELSVDVLFSNGLVKFNDSGQRTNQSVSIQIQYRLAGGSPLADWLTPEFSAKTVDSSWVSGETITFTHARTSAIRHGFRWPVATRGDYEVRIRRTTADTDSTQIFDQIGWVSLRSITDENPIQFPVNLAVTALVIKATEQLNRVIDELNGEVSSYVTSYTGSPGWTEAVSANPADLFRHVLQGPANARAVADARIDLDKLQDWHAFCADKGFEFNMVRDYASSVWETVADICAAGRASPALIDGKWSVVYDDEQIAPVQHFTPRNSWGFEAEKSFPDQPDAFRVRFINRDQNWRQDERIVYADGFDESTAENFDGLDAMGITDPDHIWKFARFHLAQASARPERWTFNVDFEYLVARRGDLIVLTHDVLLVGLAAGRIKSLTYDGSSPANITGFVSDEVLTMTGGTDYGVSIRTVANGQITKQVVTSAGDQTTVTFTTPVSIASGPEVGDLFGFGELGSETIEGLILSVEPLQELTAKLTCIPYSPAVYTSDTGTIPTFETKLTPVATIPDAIIVSVRSDESIATLGAGNTILPRVGLTVAPVEDAGLVLDIQMRVSGNLERYYAANVIGQQGNEYLIGDVETDRYYDFRVRWRDYSNNRLPNPVWTPYPNYRVIGLSTDPAALTGATISAFGGSALIRWTRATELDVRYGGTVQFRHSPETDVDSADWASSTSIGDAANADTLYAQLPLKPGTYLARVFDKSGRKSDVVKLSTKQASVLAFSNVATITESPTFAGTKTDCVVIDGVLYITADGLIDDAPDFDSIADLSSYGGIKSSATYNFSSGLDLGAVTRVRLTSTVDASTVNVLDRIDDRAGNIDDWQDFDGTDAANADCRVQVRHTDGDPAASPVVWSVWNNLDSAEFEARGFEFRALLTTDDSAYNIRVDSLGIVCDEV